MHCLGIIVAELVSVPHIKQRREAIRTKGVGGIILAGLLI